MVEFMYTWDPIARCRVPMDPAGASGGATPDEGITTAKLAPAAVTKDKMHPPAKGSTYPFQPNATFKSGGASNASVVPIYNFLQDIKLYGADKAKQYALSTIYRNNYNAGISKYIWSINIDEVQGQTKIKTVCQLNVSAYSEPATGIDIIYLPSVGGSGITGRVWVDWSAIPVGSAFVQMKYDEAGLHPSTYGDTPTTVVVLPKYIPAVAGKEMNIYLDNIILTDDLRNYNVHVTCTIGKYRDGRFTVSPTAAGDYPITVSVYRNGVYGTLLGSASSTIRVADVTAKAGLNKKCLFIGDSLTEAGIYLAELYNNLMGPDAMDMTLIGTRGTAPLSQEGRAGWTMANYLKDANFNSKSNSFLFSGSFDFTQYMTTNSFTGLDNVFIMLGTNDVSQALTTTQADLAALIASIRAYSATVNIHIGIATPPSAMQDPWSLNQTRDLFRRKLFTYYQQLLANYNGREAEKLFLVPLYVNLDTVNGFPTETAAVNSRSTVMITRQTDGVHPSNEGYYQLADTIYYHLKNFG